MTNPVPARLETALSGILIRLPEQGGAMPEHRGRKHHQDRVAETLRVEIGAMIEGELSDPRIDFCYVSEVALNPGGKSARVYVALDSAVKDIAKAEAETIAGLEAAKGFIRFALKERMGVRRVPDLTFLADRSGKFQARIEELMGRSKKKAAHRSGVLGKSGDGPKGPVETKPPAEQGAPIS
jgi:ribosome-binding factor A